MLLHVGVGLLPRLFQWSIGVQHEIARGLVVEAAYVGNRGAWWTAPKPWKGR